MFRPIKVINRLVQNILKECSCIARNEISLFYYIYLISIWHFSGFVGLEVGCWPFVPKFAGSHPAEAVGFLGRKKSSSRLPSEGK